MKKFLCLLILILPLTVFAEKSHEQIAKHLQNPLANLISVLIEGNKDFGVGESDPEGTIATTNIRPVFPIEVSEEWLLINRVTAPLLSKTNVKSSETNNGLGDISYTAFFSPSDSHLAWGIGPAFLFPTATDKSLGSRKLSLGPSAAVIKENGPWTFGVLGRQIWSLAGDSQREEVNEFSMEQLIAYTFPSSVVLAATMENVYDWKLKSWVLNLNTEVSRIIKFGNLPLNFSIGPRFFAGDEAIRPDIGLRASITFVYEKY